MIQKLAIYFGASTYQVVQIDQLKDTTTYHVGIFTHKKEQLDFVSHATYYQFDELISSLDNKVPILLIITGSSVINKSLEGQNYLSTIDLNKFYYYKFDETSKSYISVVKKTTVDGFFEHFIKSGFSIFQTSFGPFIVGAISRFVNDRANIQCGYYEFLFENKKLTAFNQLEENVDKGSLKIDNEVIDASNMLLYATIISYLYPNDNFSIDETIPISSEDDYLFKNLFNKVGMAALFTLLFLLFGSYLLLDNYSKKYVVLQESIYILQKSNDKIISYKNSIATKESIINKIGVSKQYTHTYILYDILHQLPKTVLINDLQYHPLVTKTSKKRIYQTGLVTVSGRTTKLDSFNYWINRLKNAKWLSDLSIASYKKDRKGYDNFKVILQKKESNLTQ